MKNIAYLILFMVSITQFACSSKIKITDNSESNYRIIIPSTPTEIEKYAAQEFQLFFSKVTGANLEIASDSINAQQLEICIGQTNRFDKFNIEQIIESDDAFIIKTVNEKVFIIGGNKKGTLYGVYTFLENYLGVKMLAPDVYDIPNIPNLTLPEIKVMEIPVITYRELHLPYARS